MQMALERWLVGAFLGALITGLVLTLVTAILVALGPYGPRSIESSAVAGLILGVVIGGAIGLRRPRWPQAGAGAAATLFVVLATAQVSMSVATGHLPSLLLEVAHGVQVLSGFVAGALIAAVYGVLMPDQSSGRAAVRP